MARISWVVKRLENWALWASRGGAGSGGYAKQSVLADWVSDVWERGSYNSVAIPAFEEEAAETDRAITSFKETRPHLVRALLAVYIQELGVQEAARRDGCAASTMHARLDQADMAIAMWLNDRADEKLRLRDALKAKGIGGSFTT
ncbi:hypothetical protein [Acidovorax sp. BLS4]|uniref:hypothetical protein n=1 Tax=Acidovorax sp. BLS4 TaxID=3273430 RepID=UPI002941BCD4|nr:hypothetical protein [Paracidovorax avenae]WOI43771.1 hypothetical protein R1Z03_14620 [Paracidovorax avenae]